MIDVYLWCIHGHWVFVPRQARWLGPPTKERAAHIQGYLYPLIGDWIYERQADGSLKKWQRLELWR